MNIFFILPLILFFTAYYFYGIFVATAVLMVTTVVESIIHYKKHKSLDKTRQFTLITVLILGGLTVALQNADFIKWKPTIIYWACSIAFLITQFFTKKTLAERLFSNLFTQAVEDEQTIPNHVWKPVNMAWLCFSLILGAANIYVAYTFSEQTWVNFKVFGATALTLAFSIGQGLYIFKSMKPLATTDSKEV